MKADATTPQHVEEPQPSNLLWYVSHARWAVVLSSPLLYLCIVPFVLLDVFASLYQAVCFPIYGFPR